MMMMIMIMGEIMQQSLLFMEPEDSIDIEQQEGGGARG